VRNPRTVHNWSRLQQFAPSDIQRPKSEDQLATLVAQAAHTGQRIKAMGAGHSFTAIAVTNDIHITIEHLDQLHSVDVNSGIVTVGAGITIKKLNRLLERYGLALENMGDIDKQSIAGAINTGTHGTGLAYGGIATQVRAMRIIDGTGETHDIDANQNADLFACARVGLGALGIVTRVTLQTVPAFRLHAAEETRPLEAVLEQWPELITQQDHAEFYFMPGGRKAAVKINTRTLDQPKPLPRHRYVTDKLVGENIAFGIVNRVARRTPRAAPTIARLITNSTGTRQYQDVSYKVFTTPRWVHFYETEWAVPLHALTDIITEFNTFARDLDQRVTFPVEVRCAAGDDIALSTASGHATGYIAAHVYWGTPYQQYFNGLWDITRSAGGRPHWGKLHQETADTLKPRYPAWQRFATARALIDPAGRFRNDYLDRTLGPITS